MSVLIAILVTMTMAAVDYCHARYTRAMFEHKPHQAALWSVGQWGAAAVGFVVAVKVSMWYLPFEAIGLYVGTLLGAKRVKQIELPEARLLKCRCRPRTVKKLRRSALRVNETLRR